MCTSFYASSSMSLSSYSTVNSLKPSCSKSLSTDFFFDSLLSFLSFRFALAGPSEQGAFSSLTSEFYLLILALVFLEAIVLILLPVSILKELWDDNDSSLDSRVAAIDEQFFFEFKLGAEDKLVESITS